MDMMRQRGFPARFSIEFNPDLTISTSHLFYNSGRKKKQKKLSLVELSPS
jgi:hypothetical protein